MNDRLSRRRPLSTAVAAADYGEDAVVVAVFGELDAASTSRLQERLAEAFAARPRAILVEAAEVTFCSAGILSLLLAAADNARTAGIPFAVHTHSRSMLRPVRLLGLEKALPTHGNSADAREWLQTAGRLGRCP
ncbi:STAS domain-containing protein [Amycolatopsis sp. cmx-4-68]|uniref:STAS domain-containing protein n=1 Tax=Amycolatopsis sp. cmx-4-68 TaxID=2790938 RepID=UPI003978DE2F